MALSTDPAFVAFKSKLHGLWKDLEHAASAEVHRLQEENQKLNQRLLQLDPCGASQPEAEPSADNGAVDGKARGSPNSSSVCGNASVARGEDGAPCTEDASRVRDVRESLHAKFRAEMHDQNDDGDHDKYHKTGIFQAIAKSPYFENLTLAVVVFNGVWIAVDVDLNTNDPNELIWPIMDNFFCVYFTFELLVRFGAFKNKFWPCREGIFCDGWFVFDFILVLMMVAETWIMPIITAITGGEAGMGGNAGVLRLLRLLRLTRMAKMMRSVPELLIMIKGTVVGIRSVTITLVLLAAITAVFAIALRTLTDGTEVGAEWFSSVPQSAITLLIQGVIPDNGDLMISLGETKWYYGLLFLSFIFLAALTFMNMLIGILCEAVHDVAVDEKELINVDKMKQLMKEFVGNNFKKYSTPPGQPYAKDKFIPKKLFLAMMDDDMVLQSMLDLGVDALSLIDNSSAFNNNDGGLKFEDLFDFVIKFRARDDSMVKVMFEVRAMISDRMQHFEEKLKEIIHKVNAVERHVVHGPGPHMSVANADAKAVPYGMEISKPDPSQNAAPSSSPYDDEASSESESSSEAPEEQENPIGLEGVVIDRMTEDVAASTRDTPRTNAAVQNYAQDQRQANHTDLAVTNESGEAVEAQALLAEQRQTGAPVTPVQALVGAPPTTSWSRYKIEVQDAEELGCEFAINDGPFQVSIVSAGAAQNYGVLPGHILVAINNIEQTGMPRDKLMLSLQARPLMLTFAQHLGS